MLQRGSDADDKDARELAGAVRTQAEAWAAPSLAALAEQILTGDSGAAATG
jgi:hypothetical protein